MTPGTNLSLVTTTPVVIIADVSGTGDETLAQQNQLA
jgi:hypothetical protein